ncbi:MAG: hypothetical protein K8S18_11120, partial [Desulfobacula sp.]|nr:hypothetical protein [Desulfobacula sp.]
CTFEHAYDRALFYDNIYDPATVTNNVFSYCPTAIYYDENGAFNLDSLIQGNTFGNNNYAVYMAFGDPEIQYNDFNNNSNYAVYNAGIDTINAENNWWGSDTGPNHSSNPGGTGDSVSDFVDFFPYLMGPFKNFCECDLNRDGRCDMQDWLKFGEDWGRTDCNDLGVDCECDLNADGRCDMQDWLKFGEDWGRTDCP